MNPFTVLRMVAILVTSSCANPTESNERPIAVGDSLRSSQLLTPIELEDTVSFREITLETLENTPLEKGAKIMQTWYHTSQINHQLTPSFFPNHSDIPVYIIKGNGEKETSVLNDFVEIAKKNVDFGNSEVTVFITGFPSTVDTINKANGKLIQAYIERYSSKQEKSENNKSYNDETGVRTSEWNNQKSTSGNLIVIDLGQTLENIERIVMLDIDEVGAMIGKALVQLTSDCDVYQEIIHVVAQGVAAHVAGATGDEYARLTGQKLRRITALDPSKVLAKNPQILTGLSRGDAEFVDAIHTSVYGLGTLAGVGDIDFFPNGPCAGVPGAENVLEASMRATHYFAESLHPGNERNFPAVEANSLKQYKSNNGFGKRAYMGIATDYDLKGDYILQVNEKSPFGKRALIKKHNTRYGNHEPWYNYKY